MEARVHGGPRGGALHAWQPALPGRLPENDPLQSCDSKKPGPSGHRQVGTGHQATRQNSKCESLCPRQPLAPACSFQTHKLWTNSLLSKSLRLPGKVLPCSFRCRRDNWSRLTVSGLQRQLPSENLQMSQVALPRRMHRLLLSTFHIAKSMSSRFCS